MYRAGWAGALPLLAVHCVSVASTWLLLREQTLERCALDYHLIVGSLPLLVCLFWWSGENRPLHPAPGLDIFGDGGAVLAAFNATASNVIGGTGGGGGGGGGFGSALFWELGVSQHLQLWALCVLDHMRGVLAARLLVGGISHRFFVGLELLALGAALLFGLAMSHELVSLAAVLLLGISFVSSFTFVSSAALSFAAAVERKKL